MNPDESPLRAYLKSVLDPTALQRLDAMLAYIEQNPPDEQGEPGDAPEDVTKFGVENVRDYLSEILNPEQLQIVDHLVSQLDSGDVDVDELGELDQRAEQRREEQGGGKSQEESQQMHAFDSAEPDHGLRMQLRRAGVPVGSQGDRANLQRLWRNRPGGPAAIAMDSARASAHLSFGRMWPSIRSRYAASGLAIYPDRTRHESAASSARMAYDSAPGYADPKLSIRAMFPSLAERLKIR